MEKTHLCVGLLLLCYVGYGKLLSGTVDTTQNTVYFGKFTFAAATLDDPGNLVFKVSNVAPYIDSLSDHILLNFYTDEPEHPWYFPNIWNNPKLSCEEKVALQYPIQGQYGTPVNGTDLLLIFANSKDVTWFWTISDCQLYEGQYLQMNAQMHWTNPGGWWYTEFSVEDQNLLTIYLIFCVFWFGLTLVCGACIFIFFTKQSRELDWNLFLFMFSLVFITISMIFYTMHYFVFAADGLGIPSFLVIADVLDNLADIIFMLVMLQIVSLVGSPEQLNLVTKVCAGTLLIAYLMGFFWQEIYAGLNPTEVVYKWETTPGIIMLTIRVIVWALFITLGGLSAYYNRDRRWFLAVFVVVFSVWFLILPFMVIVMSGVSYYYQWKVVLGVTETFYFFTFCFFLVLATPNPVSKRINGISFYIRKVATELSTGNINFLSRQNHEDDL